MDDLLPMEFPLCWIVVVISYLYSFGKKVVKSHFSQDSIELDREVFDENEDGCGLVVVLSGYKARRYNFITQLGEMRKVLSKDYRAVYAPIVHYEADKNIMDSNVAIFSYLHEFCKENPHEPILIVGISAGGRLAILLCEMMRRIDVRMHIVTLASPINGTSLVRLTPFSFNIAVHFIGEKLVEEFDPQSSKQLELGETILNSESNRTFFHFYSTTDWMVFPPHRCVSPLGAPKCYVKGIRACAHSAIQTHPEVLEYLGKFKF